MHFTGSEAKSLLTRFGFGNEFVFKIGVHNHIIQLFDKIAMEIIERKEKEAALHKKERRKTNFIIISIFTLICITYISITVSTHSSIMAGILALIIGVLILIYLPFFLGYLIELFLHKKIVFNGWLVFVSVIVSGALGLFIGSTTYKACIYEYGDDNIVYVTDEGYCYHKDPNCFELTGHHKRSVRFGSIKNQKRACEICSR